MKLDKTLNQDMGKQFAAIEKAVTDLEDGAIGAISTTGLTENTADATDLPTALTLLNALKAKHNLLVSRIAAAQQ